MFRTKEGKGYGLYDVMQNTILTNTVIVFRLYHATKHDQLITQREEPNDSGHELLHMW